MSGKYNFSDVSIGVDALVLTNVGDDERMTLDDSHIINITSFLTTFISPDVVEGREYLLNTIKDDFEFVLNTKRLQHSDAELATARLALQKLVNLIENIHEKVLAGAGSTRDLIYVGIGIGIGRPDCGTAHIQVAFDNALCELLSSILTQDWHLQSLLQWVANVSKAPPGYINSSRQKVIRAVHVIFIALARTIRSGHLTSLYVTPKDQTPDFGRLTWRNFTSEIDNDTERSVNEVLDQDTDINLRNDIAAFHAAAMIEGVIEYYKDPSNGSVDDLLTRSVGFNVYLAALQLGLIR